MQADSPAQSPETADDSQYVKLSIDAQSTYTGKNANIVSMLSRRAAETFSVVSSRQVGPIVEPLPSPSYKRTSRNTLSVQSISKFQPKGMIISSSSEHTGWINKIQISPDNSFYVTFSDDGTIKIWSLGRLGSSAIGKSAFTYSEMGNYEEAGKSCL